MRQRSIIQVIVETKTNIPYVMASGMEKIKNVSFKHSIYIRAIRAPLKGVA